MNYKQQVTHLKEALCIGLAMAENVEEYAHEALATHLLSLGETTQKNKFRAMRMREDISAAKDAQVLFRKILQPKAA